MRVCIAVACRDVQFCNTSKTAVFANVEGRNASIDAIFWNCENMNRFIQKAFFSFGTTFYWFLLPYLETKKKLAFKTGTFVKTTNTVYTVHAVLKLAIYIFCMRRYLHVFLITLKIVNSAIYAFWRSREREPLFDCRCGVGASEAEKVFCLTRFRHNIPCQFFCHFVHLLSVACLLVWEKNS